MRLKFFAILLLASVMSLVSGLLVAYAQTPAPQTPGKLRVVTKPLEPFVIVQPDGGLTGFSIDLWDEIAKDLQLDYEWVQVATVKDQLAAVQDGRADVAIAGISMTPEREQIIDFTHPYFDAGLRIMTSAQSRASPLQLISTILSPALLQVLGIGLLTLLVMAHIIWLVERGSNEAMPKAYLPGIWEAMWWSLSTIATLEYGDKSKPHNILKRLLAMLLVVMGIILIAQFTAAITASLTVQQLTGSIQGPSDLPGKQIATVANSTSSKYLDGERLSYIGVSRIEEAYPLLESGKVDAIVYDSPVLLYYANNKGNGRVQITGQIIKPEKYGIALPPGSPIRKKINETILKFRQDGTYDVIYQKWFGNTQ